MVVVHDDHNKFTSKCIHVHRYRHSHWPARYLSVFLVLSTRQLKISTLFILVSPLVPETDRWASPRRPRAPAPWWAESWSQRMAQGVLAKRSVSSLGPCSTRRRCASLGREPPRAGSTCSREGSSSVLSWCGSKPSRDLPKMAGIASNLSRRSQSMQVRRDFLRAKSPPGLLQLSFVPGRPYRQPDRRCLS